MGIKPPNTIEACLELVREFMAVLSGTEKSAKRIGTQFGQKVTTVTLACL